MLYSYSNWSKFGQWILNKWVPGSFDPDSELFDSFFFPDNDKILQVHFGYS